MALPTQRLVHTFGALADLGQEITESSDVSEMVQTSLQLVLGALGIRRGVILEHIAIEESLTLVATRGVEEAFPEALSLNDIERAALLGVGLSALPPFELATRKPELAKLIEQCQTASGAFDV